MLNYSEDISDNRRGRLIASPLKVVVDLFKLRDLIKQFVNREVSSRYRGSYLGIFWSFITPLFMLSVYTFVFSVIFKARWGVGSGSKVEFALVLFTGLATFNIIGECLNRAPALIISNVNYVKKVVFPLEILPVVALGSALVQGFISFGILAVALLFFQGGLHWTIVLLPIVLLPLVLLSLGVGWFFSALGAYIKDIVHIMGVFVQVLMYMTPIFYPVSQIPEYLRWVFFLNPISNVVEDMRRIMIWGQMPDWKLLLVGTVISGVLAYLGHIFFQKTRGGFADVI
jgi:lipopolysaccharide transport system permease protein